MAQSRLILLDAPLVLFTLLAVACYVWHRTRTPFTPAWWALLAGAGCALGCACSVKLVGLFVVLLLGALTLRDLHAIYADRSVPLVRGRVLIGADGAVVAVPLMHRTRRASPSTWPPAASA